MYGGLFVGCLGSVWHGAKRLQMLLDCLVLIPTLVSDDQHDFRLKQPDLCLVHAVLQDGTTAVCQPGQESACDREGKHMVGAMLGLVAMMLSRMPAQATRCHFHPFYCRVHPQWQVDAIEVAAKVAAMAAKYQGPPACWGKQHCAVLKESFCVSHTRSSVSHRRQAQLHHNFTELGV